MSEQTHQLIRLAQAVFIAIPFLVAGAFVCAHIMKGDKGNVSNR